MADRGDTGSRTKQRQPRIGTEYRVLATGVGVTVGLTALLAALTDTKALVVATVGLLGLIISLQLEFIVRVQAVVDRFERAHREERIARLVEDIGPNTRIYELFEAIAEAFRSTAGVEIFQTAARSVLEESAAFFERLSEGRLRTAPNPLELVALLRAARVSVKEAVDANDIDSWLSSRGAEYSNASREAISRGVSIRCVFVTDGAPWPAMATVMAKQRAVGVLVYVVDRQYLPLDMRGPGFVILDDALSVEMSPSATADSVPSSSWEYAVEPSEVSAVLKRFVAILAFASEWTDPRFTL